MDPSFPAAIYYLARCYEGKSMFEKAIGEYRNAITLFGGNAGVLAALAYAYAVSGRSGEARDVLNELMELSK